jgi:hypothetical protein
MTHKEDNQLHLHVSTGLFDVFTNLKGALRPTADQEIVDCMWKLQAAHHHCRNVQILERIQLETLKNKSETLEDGWLTIGSDPNPLLRFEFEAELQQIYSALNIASSAIVKMLGVGRTISFRNLENKLIAYSENATDACINEKVNKCKSLIKEAKNGVLSEYLTSQSMRDKIVHFHCLRARPIQIMNKNEAQIIIHKITKDNVLISSLDERENVEHKIKVKGQWNELLSLEFVVYSTEQTKWTENSEYVEFGAQVSNVENLDMSSYSETLYEGARKLVLDLLSAIIESNKTN